MLDSSIHPSHTHSYWCRSDKWNTIIDIFMNPGRNPVDLCKGCVCAVTRHKSQIQDAVPHCSSSGKSVWGRWESHCLIYSLPPPASVYHTHSCANAMVYDFCFKTGGVMWTKLNKHYKLKKVDELSEKFCCWELASSFSYCMDHPREFYESRSYVFGSILLEKGAFCWMIIFHLFSHYHRKAMNEMWSSWAGVVVTAYGSGWVAAFKQDPWQFPAFCLAEHTVAGLFRSTECENRKATQELSLMLPRQQAVVALAVQSFTGNGDET